MRQTFFFIFALSGFAGLIYESIWSHYLKLFLGHAAYAQTLVLAIFMGGMAIGAWLCSRYGHKWRNLLLGYALVEAIIGIVSMFFHNAFDGTVQLAYSALLPAIGSPEVVALSKWLIAALLILPQSILLGTTFPLMAAGILRKFPGTPGRSIATLYFSNSIGASLGVIASGFLFIEWVGLPGTIRIAGTLNISLALLVWYLVRQDNIPHKEPDKTISSQSAEPGFFKLLLTIAALTGAASFIYEIVWIRMLSLVLGSSTHAFELMLSAFILGLALGGLWIKRNIERVTNVIHTLAIVQLAMGLLALLTLPLYDYTFDVMHWLTNTLPKTDSGYTLFNLSSHAIAMAVMLPTTICAGMTLPLITYALLSKQHGEKSIGAVYSANTLGAIVGVFFATHIGLPQLGIKGLLTIGAIIDIALAVFLFAKFSQNNQRNWLLGSATASILAVVLISTIVELDIYKMSSGVYRSGKFVDRENIEILYHRDGRVATVDLQKDKTGNVNIRTNGKVDANIQVDETQPISFDEPTMVMAAVIPMSMLPNAESAAVIGMGSGLSSHTLLTNPYLKVVDTIEIEPAIVEAANGFRPRVENVYSDPRSHIYIEDAKTYFSNNNKRYDIIISEPSNPWVSGTASLFTEEFYRFLPNYLNEDGILVQWMQLYELDIELIASVTKALSKHFFYYSIYAATDLDILIVASNKKLKQPGKHVFETVSIRKALNRVYVGNISDFHLRLIAEKKVIQPLFDSYPIRANSDYYPVLDLGAAKTRFFQTNAAEIVLSPFSNLPIQNIIGNIQPLQYGQPTKTDLNFLTPLIFSQLSINLRNKFLYNTPFDESYLGNYKISLDNLIIDMRRYFVDCNPTQTRYWLDALFSFSHRTLPYLAARDSQLIWGALIKAPCFAKLTGPQQDWVTLLDAISHRQFKKMSGIAQWLLKHDVAVTPAHFDFLVSTALLGKLLDENQQAALSTWQTHKHFASKEYGTELGQRLLLARIGALPQISGSEK